MEIDGITFADVPNSLKGEIPDQTDAIAKLTAADGKILYVCHQRNNPNPALENDWIVLPNQQKWLCYAKVDIASMDEIVEPNPDPQILDTAVWDQDYQFWVNSEKLVKINRNAYLKGEMIIVNIRDEMAKWKLDCGTDENTWASWGWHRKEMIKIHNKKGRLFPVKKKNLSIFVDRIFHCFVLDIPTKHKWR